MSKKMMLLALAVAALFALPSAASAQEIHISGVTSFTGKGSASSLVVTDEPKISCTSTSASGGFNAGSTTTGTVNLTYTGCTAEFLGIKGKCSSSGHTVESETITSSGTFHLITTLLATAKPAIMVTPVTTTIICLGFSRIELTGNGLIGTITSPTCGSSSKTIGVSFEAEGPFQKHREYTGKGYDLSADTENSEGVTTGAYGTVALSATTTLESATAGTLECT
jgi:hypothetical protein